MAWNLRIGSGARRRNLPSRIERRPPEASVDDVLVSSREVSSRDVDGRIYNIYNLSYLSLSALLAPLRCNRIAGGAISRRSSHSRLAGTQLARELPLGLPKSRGVRIGRREPAAIFWLSACRRHNMSGLRPFWMPEGDGEKKKKKGPASTICISSQVGCPV